MKPILYVGATLMIGASIYGFVDYRKTSHSKEFVKMYDEKEQPADSIVITPPKVEMAKKEEVVAIPAITVSPKPASEGKKTTSVKRKTINLKLFSRAPLEERYINKKSGNTEKPEGQKN